MILAQVACTIYSSPARTYLESNAFTDSNISSLQLSLIEKCYLHTEENQILLKPLNKESLIKEIAYQKTIQCISVTNIKDHELLEEQFQTFINYAKELASGDPS